MCKVTVLLDYLNFYTMLNAFINELTAKTIQYCMKDDDDKPYLYFCITRKAVIADYTDVYILCCGVGVDLCDNQKEIHIIFVLLHRKEAPHICVSPTCQLSICQKSKHS